MNMPLISVIIPIYKVELFLHKCIDSIILQSFSDIEIILVDDGSPDNCGKICDNYASKDSRIVVIHKQNGGLSSARNAGIDIAKGDYLMFVDSDDWVEKDFCETAYKLITENNVTCASFGYFEHKNNIIKPLGTKNPRLINAEEGIKSLIALDDVIYNMACNKIFHNRLFSTIKFPEGKLFEDQGTMYKLFDVAGQIYVDSTQLYHYIRRDDSITTGGGTAYATSAKGLNDIFDLWYERLLFIERRYPKLKNIAIKQIADLIVWAFHVLSWQKDKDLITKFEGFLKEYKKDILSLGHKSRWLKIFYSNFYLYRLCFWSHSLFQE